MPVAAVPAYLGRNFKNASPALRFGMLLPLWGVNRHTKELLWTTSDISHEVRGPLRQEREIKLNNKVDALAQAAALNPEDKAAMKALADRQSHLAGNLPHMLSLDATAIAPFTTGLGNEHPLENGFAFLNPYGLPYLAGSGVKGVLRQAARELASGQWGNEHGWSADKQFEIRVNGKSLAISWKTALPFSTPMACPIWRAAASRACCGKPRASWHQANGAMNTAGARTNSLKSG